MRIARIEIDGAPRAAVVSPDGESARLLPADVRVIDLLAAEPDDRESIAGRASFSNPHAVNGPGADVAVPPGCVDLDWVAAAARAFRRWAPETSSA